LLASRLAVEPQVGPRDAHLVSLARDDRYLRIPAEDRSRFGVRLGPSGRQSNRHQIRFSLLCVSRALLVVGHLTKHAHFGDYETRRGCKSWGTNIVTRKAASSDS
jgi:hypothetical protein